MEESHRPRLNGGSAMWAVALLLAVAFVGSVLPTPLYPAYSKQFHFSEIIVTLIYAVYVAGTLTALVFFGRLSDQIGRRAAVLPALGIVAVSTLIFIFAFNMGMLFVGRVLVGFSIGIVSGTATAWVVELHPKRIHAHATLIVVAFNEAGLALGPPMTGLLTQYAPLPLRLTYVVYLPLLFGAAAIAWMAEETVREPVHRIKDISLRPRIGVPGEIRKQFVAPAATAFAIFALSGVYFALAPNLLAQVLHLTSPAVSGAVVFELSFAAAIAIVLTRSLSSRKAMLIGMELMIPAIAMLEVARELKSLPILLGATALGGIAVALGYRGSLEVVNQIAPGEQRAEVLSSYFIACYIGLALPVIGVGVLSRWANPQIANVTFSVVVAIFAGIAIVMGFKYAPKRR